MRNSFLLLLVLLLGGTLACKSTNPSNNFSDTSPLNVAGNWTITVISSQGRGTVSATANVAQSGQGVGTDGVTTLTSVAGSITVSQSGTNLTGTITNSAKSGSYNFTGSLSGGNITIAGSSIACGMGVMGTQSASMTGTIAATQMHGNYTITRDSACYYPSDAGTWTATKQ